MNHIRVILADDHPLVRMGIRSHLEKDPEISVVGEASDGREALRLVRELSPDVILLDMEMPGLHGYEVAKIIKEEGLPVQILGLSAHDDKHYIQEMLSCGASGYLVKDEAMEVVTNAVRAVARGEQGWLSRRATRQIASLMFEEPPRTNGLTPREMQILRAVVDGMTNQEIGYTFGISVKTVEKHLDGIYAKLQVSTRVEAAVLALQKGIV